jgi:protein transport protein SEC23
MARCAAALQVTEALLTASVPAGSCMARMMLFVGGPCTEGAGKIVGRELTEEIRSHKVGSAALAAVQGGGGALH